MAGVIDWRKAATIVTTLGPVADEVAWTVQHDVLATAGGRTHNQIARDLARELVKVDPEEAAARHARAVRGQHVTHPRALADGMASMYIVAGAEDAVPFDLLLTNAARAARADGDTRGVDVLRAEALFALAAGALHTGTAGPPGGHCTCPRHDPTDHLTRARRAAPDRAPAADGERRRRCRRRRRHGGRPAMAPTRRRRRRRTATPTPTPARPARRSTARHMAARAPAAIRRTDCRAGSPSVDRRRTPTARRGTARRGTARSGCGRGCRWPGW